MPIFSRYAGYSECRRERRRTVLVMTIGLLVVAAGYVLAGLDQKREEARRAKVQAEERATLEIFYGPQDQRAVPAHDRVALR